MKHQKQLFKNETQKYLALGMLFGFMFPIAATLIRISSMELPLNLAGVLAAQASDPLLWLIDTAPFFLGLFARLIGMRQDQLRKLGAELQQRENKAQEEKRLFKQRYEEGMRSLNRRTSQFQAVAAVGKSITSFRNLSELLQQTTKLIHESFGYYHAGIFLMDERREYAVLAAANSEGGQRMLGKKHRLKIGGTSIVGYAIENVQARIALDVGQDAVYFDNPDLPETRSELALPLVASGQVLGALDVQSDESQAFTEEDISVLQILAEQIAIAIQNANLFSEAEKALESARIGYGEISREAWGKILRSQPRIGFLSTTAGGAPVESGTLEPSLDKTLKTGDLIVDNNERTIGVPVTIRGQVIGAIRLRKPDIAEAWTREEINLAMTLSEQLSGALESARLYRESQVRAARESLVSDISAKISAATQTDAIIRETVSELGQAFGSASVTFQLLEANGRYPASDPQRRRGDANPNWESGE